MPHTISPTPDSAGLGISFSTLSPPPISSTSQVPARPLGLTGMGVGPVPQILPTKPDSAVTSSTATPPRPLPSPTRPPLISSTRAHPLFQPTFSLRPTHTRHNSSFTSFSAFPPSSSSPTNIMKPSSPMGPRPSTSTPRGTAWTSGSSLRDNSGAGPSNPSQIQPTSFTQEPLQAQMSSKSPKRSGSTTSNSTTTSARLAGKLRRVSKSSDMIRRISQASYTETVSGGKYQPLSGHEEIGVNDEKVEILAADDRYDDSTSSSHRRGVATSSSKAEDSPRTGLSYDQTPTSESANVVSSAFPLPPSSNPHAYQSDYLPQTRHYAPDQQVDARGFTRSHSSPHFESTAEASGSNTQYPDRPFPTQNHSDSQTIQEKRFSNPMSVSHSQNAALLSAESGGMMLAFSPSEGVYRTGQVICGDGTGLIPTPQAFQTEDGDSPLHVRHVSYPSREGRRDEEQELKARPWSESTNPHALSSSTRQATTTSSRPGQRGRSLSDGVAMLARQGTLLHPSSSNQRASAELGVLLGGPRSKRLSQNKLLPPPELAGWNQAANGKGMGEGLNDSDKIRLEAAKKGKARVEVDVVLERECVVEGGEVRGRLEVKVRGGKRGEGVRVGGGKVRVVGFEDLSSTSRHIFYHQPHALPLFANPPLPNGPTSSLFMSEADAEGYYLAAEGTHFIPFSFRLPLGGGAKGCYTSPGGKGPSIRYVVVGSIKILIPPSKRQSINPSGIDGQGFSGIKRSIAHFYRSIVVLPYLNPSLVLAPSDEVIEAHVESGLGWSLTGEKGRVEVRISLGRKVWVSGQRVWCEVGIRNDSTKKIKTLNLALLQTVQLFNPQDDLDVQKSAAFRPTLPTRASIMNCIPPVTPATPDADACQTSTTRRKVSEEIVEADTGSGGGRVTGSGWWTGVDPGERGHWDMSLQIPTGMISIRRTRLIEVSYLLRVTVNNTIYVDLPVQLINFLSIDPPPMPGDGRFANRLPMVQSLPQPDHLGLGADGQPVRTSVYQTRTSVLARMRSDESMMSGGNPAIASSTTLHIDALLEEGRVRAEMEGENAGINTERTRPLSMGSDYERTPSGSPLNASTSQTPDSNAQRPKSQGAIRPKGARVMSYLSIRSGGESIISAGEDESDLLEEDKAILEARRRQGRQMSLAAITRAMDRAQQDALDNDEGEATPTPDAVEDSDEQQVYLPAETPFEEVYKIIGDTPSMASVGEHGQSPFPPSSRSPELDVIDSAMEVEEERDPRQLSHVEDEEEEEEDHDGDRTILAELVADHTGINTSVSVDGSIPLPSNDADYDYGEEVEDEAHDLERNPTFRPTGQLSTDDGEYPQARPRFDSFANSVTSDQEFEVGQVFEAVKRNVSTRLPPRLLPLSNGASTSPGGRHLAVPRSGSVSSRLGPSETSLGRRSSHTPTPSQLPRKDSNTARGGTTSRRGSAPNIQGSGMRRESSKPSSPLRPSISIPTSRSLSKKPSFTFATPGAPLKINTSASASLSPGTRAHVPISPSLSPMSLPTSQAETQQMSHSMRRGPSANSQLRNQVTADEEEDGSGLPGLAPSVASDSSSDGQVLESPPIASPTASNMPRPKIHAMDSIASTLHAYDMALNKSLPISSEVQQKSWIPSQHFKPQVNLMHHHQTPPSSNYLESSGGFKVRSPYRIMTPASPTTSSENSNHSILPSVQTKIAQLESRDEALRKFSVSATLAPSSPSQSYSSQLNHVPIQASTSTNPVQGKRRSYTAALAPRSPPYVSDYRGFQSPVRRTYSNTSPTIDHDDVIRQQSPKIHRKISTTSSHSLGATTIEHALMNMSPPILSLSKVRNEEDTYEGEGSYEDHGGLGSIRGFGSSTSGSRSKRNGYTGGGSMSPGSVRSTSQRFTPPVRKYVAEDTDESEGLL